MSYNVPLLGLATIMVIRSIGKVHIALRSYPKKRRCALGLAALVASVPVLAAMEYAAYTIIVIGYAFGVLFECG